MKKYFYSLGAFGLALNVTGIPTVTAMPVGTVPAVTVPAVPKPSVRMPAEDAVEAWGGTTGVSVGGVQVGADGSVKAGEVEVTNTGVVRTGDVQVTGTSVRAGTVRVDTNEDGSTNIQVGDDVQVTADAEGTTSVRAGEVEVKGNSVTVGGVRLDLEDSAVPAFSLGELKRSIEERKQELEQELASTTDADQNLLENANPVRLAVHSLLASKELLGGIGQQVSEIAKQMNDSIATTTVAEAKIQSRGFLTKFFFGGDSAAANAISETVAQNQERIDALTKLLDQAAVSADIQATLEAQITALEDAQTRLQDIARGAKKQWGIFSWRLF